MKYMTTDELKKQLLTIKNERWRLAALIAFWHGLRVSEIVEMTGKDIQHGHVDVKRLKGSMHTIQRWQKHPDPILDEYSQLEKIAVTVKPTEKLFPITRDGLLKVMKRAGVKNGLHPKQSTFHALKHSQGMFIIPAGIEVARQRLGHTNVSSTGYYINVSDDTAADAIDKLIGARA
jgi:integrase